MLLVWLLLGSLNPFFEAIESRDLNEARQALQLVDVDPARRFALRGMLAILEDDPDSARALFDAAFKQGLNDPSLPLAIAATWLDHDKPNEALPYLEDLPQEPLLAREALVLRFEAYRQNGNDREAHLSILEAIGAAPTDCQLRVVALKHAADLSLHQQVTEHGEALLNAACSVPYLLSVMHVMAELGDSIALLERFAARHPNDGRVWAHVAYAYARNRMHRPAGRLYARAVALGDDFALESADQFQRAGMHDRAAKMNRLAPIGPARHQQAIEILSSTGAWTRLVAYARGISVDNLSARSRYQIAWAAAQARYVGYARGVLEGLSGDSEYGARSTRLLDALP